MWSLIVNLLQKHFQLAEGCDAEHARRVFNYNASKVVRDSFNKVRIQAICAYYKEVKGIPMNQSLGAAEIYLTEDEYAKVDEIIYLTDWCIEAVSMN